MNLQEFKDRLAAQGVSYETFKERVFNYCTHTINTEEDVENLVFWSKDFRAVMMLAFAWWRSPERYNFWKTVADETHCTLSVIQTLKDFASSTRTVTISDHNEPKTLVCECGAEKCKTPHSHWCPIWKGGLDGNV